ncbi:hypothetical protein AJ78_04095 [Emergomyces pasteurianus Ep9510]|uniref:Uncharacterized protein n=1 Tax=Emergomyces pasteurianus Ep9510 TaxID=1447872 RepID=A0A1J9QKF8_9EURO|nr:hypothetical protein AJ78_04095 [Emergomyces pasteurianus Ep9510]
MTEKSPVKMKWNAATEAKLLKQIIKNAKLGKKDHEELARFMGCTPRAIREHISQMQKGAPAVESGVSAPSTPVKTAKVTPKKHTQIGSMVGNKKRQSSNEEDDGEENGQIADRLVKRAKYERSNEVEAEDLLSNYV